MTSEWKQDMKKRKEPRKETRYIPTTKSELIHWYGFHILMENTYGNEHTNIQKHHTYIKQRFGNNNIGMKKKMKKKK